jgi:hypothetical protein
LTENHLPTNPSHYQRHSKIHLHLTQRPALFDSMPLINASPATGGGNNRALFKFKKFMTA